MDSRFDGLQEIIDKALTSMEAESTGDYDPQKCNLVRLIAFALRVEAEPAFGFEHEIFRV